MLRTRVSKEYSEEFVFQTIPACALVSVWQLMFYPMIITLSLVLNLLDYMNVYVAAYDYFCTGNGEPDYGDYDTMLTYW